MPQLWRGRHATFVLEACRMVRCDGLDGGVGWAGSAFRAKGSLTFAPLSLTEVCLQMSFIFFVFCLFFRLNASVKTWRRTRCKTFFFFYISFSLMYNIYIITCEKNRRKRQKTKRQKRHFVRLLQSVKFCRSAVCLTCRSCAESCRKSSRHRPPMATVHRFPTAGRAQSSADGKVW